MKIAKAMKVIARTKGEINSLTSRITNAVVTVEGNAFKEDIPKLKKQRDEEVEKLKCLKVRVMETNIKHGMFETIVSISELKNEIEMFRDMDIKEGKTNERYGSNEVTYITQISEATRNDKVAELQNNINEFTDALDVFNASTDLIK